MSYVLAHVVAAKFGARVIANAPCGDPVVCGVDCVDAPAVPVTYLPGWFGDVVAVIDLDGRIVGAADDDVAGGDAMRPRTDHGGCIGGHGGVVNAFVQRV